MLDVLYIVAIIVVVLVLFGGLMIVKNHLDGVYEVENKLKPREGSDYQFVTLPEGRMAYKLRGNPNAELVVLVHGFSSYSYVNDELAKRLVGEGFYVLQPDLYGRGYSSTPHGSYDARYFVNQIAALLYKLETTRDRRIVLFGSSMSGAVATMFTYLYPERVDRLFLYAPAGFPMTLPLVAKLTRYPFLGEVLLSLAGRKSLLEHIDEGFANPTDPKVAPILRRERLAILTQWDGNPPYRRALARTLANFEFQTMSNIYREVGKLGLGKKVTLIWGTKDTTVPYFLHTQVLDALPGARFVKLEGFAHDICEDEERINQIIFDEIKKIN